ncbi:MAG: ferritin-like protein [Flavobacteriales bacterium]|nr:ferritin-like protein [Flavobacteriales bacterium]
MRQKLIHKKEKATKRLLKSSGAAEMASNEMDVSLADLLFNPHLGKEAWMNGIKAHSKELISTLLSENYEQEFDAYLKSNFSDLNKSAETKNALKNSSILQVDERAFLQEFLQLAVLIEHSTIPPYLTAMYSVKEGANGMAVNIIRSVVIEEMLHMIMVCNVLNAINIVPSVNKPQNYPTYPMKLPLNVDFYVGLEKFSSNSIATFIAIESPSSQTVKAPEFPEPEMESTALLKRKTVQESDGLWTSNNLNEFLTKNVSTIGEFYDVLFFFLVIFQCLEYYRENGKLPTSFEEINTGGLFTGDPKLQLGSEHYYGSGGKLYKVEDLRGVMQVFEEIKGQGEGVDDSIFDVDRSQFEEGAELAHYFRFKEIFHERFYVEGNYEAFTDENGRMPVITPPTGIEMKVDWDAVYPMKANVKMADYASNPLLYAQGKAFNQTYKKLLDAIQAAVEGKQEVLAESVMYMYALKEQAIELMRQPLTAQENAGPTFEYPTN